MTEHSGGPRPAAATRVGVIVGSTRANRICPEIARQAQEHLAASSPFCYKLVDLAEIDLPFLDEPFKPALGHYAHDHTRRWSRLVSSFGAFVFVSPQYNWGYPAPLKNALDFLYAEWRDKPAALITYGTRGGRRAAEQLRTVLAGLHMRAVETSAEIKISPADIDAEGRLIDPRELLSGYVSVLRGIDAELAAALRPAPGGQRELAGDGGKA
jgi:NAD(P)H-dependent FMN reductase